MITKKVTFKYINDGNKYFIDGERQPTLNLIKGETYIFDWSLAPTHPFRFSLTSGGTHNDGIEFLDGVIKNDKEYFTSIIVPQNIDTLYYYCKVHAGMGGKLNLINARSIRQTDFPKKGDDKKVSLRNSEYERFPLEFAQSVKEQTPEIWRAGGNIEGNRSFRILEDHIENGTYTETVIDKIKERESWTARHEKDGSQFVSGKLSPNLSNVAGVVALMKWLSVNPDLGVQGMKDVILELTKKLEGKKSRQVSGAVAKGIKNKVDQHNEDVKDSNKKWNPRSTVAKATKVFERGIGAYKTNPGSVRPNVSSPEQWAFARLNSWHFALKNGRFQGGKHDTDLLPEGHPQKTEKEKKAMAKTEKRDIQKIEENEDSITIQFSKSPNYEEMDRIIEDENKEVEDEKKTLPTDDDEEKSYYDDDKKDKKKPKNSLDVESKENPDDKEKDRSEDVNRLFRSAFLNKRKIDNEKRTAEFSFMSDEPVERDFGIESIDVTKSDMSFVSSGRAPLLLDHDTKAQIGVIEKAEIVDGKGRAIARFGKSQLANEVFEDVKSGIRQNISVGYLIKEMTKVEEEDEDESLGRDFFRVGIKPLEISMVSVPADTTVGIGRSLNKSTTITVKGDAMEKAKTEVTEPVVNKDQIQKTEMTRIREISAIGKKHNLQDLADSSVRDGHSVAEFKGLVLDKIGNSKPLDTDPNEVGLSAKENRRYSIANGIRASLTNDWSKAGFEREVSQEIEKQSGRTARGFFVPGDVFKRDLTQGTATAGGHVTPDVHRGDLFIDALRSTSVVQQAGATIFRGLKGDIKIPRLTTKGTVGFVAENSATSETNQAFDQVTMTERTLGGFVDLSRVLINNSDPSIEQIVRNDMTQQIGLKIDEVAFEGGGSNEPTGIIQTGSLPTVAIGTNGGAITYDATIDLIKEVAKNSALRGSLGYVATPEVIYQMRKTPKVSSTDSVMIMDNADQLNGYRVYQSSQLPKDLTKGSLSGTAHAMLFGNFQDLLIGYYSGLDVLVDPFTGSSAGTVRLNFFTGMDVAVRHINSFSAILDIDETA